MYFFLFVVLPVFQPLFLSHGFVIRYFHLLFYMRLDAFSFLNVNVMDSSRTGLNVSASPHYKIYCYFLLQYFK